MAHRQAGQQHLRGAAAEREQLFDDRAGAPAPACPRRRCGSTATAGVPRRRAGLALVERACRRRCQRAASRLVTSNWRPAPSSRRRAAAVQVDAAGSRCGRRGGAGLGRGLRSRQRHRRSGTLAAAAASGGAASGARTSPAQTASPQRSGRRRQQRPLPGGAARRRGVARQGAVEHLARGLLDDLDVDDGLVDGIGAQQRAVAQQVDAARHARASWCTRHSASRSEGQRSAEACHREAVADVLRRFLPGSAPRGWKRAMTRASCSSSGRASVVRSSGTADQHMICSSLRSLWSQVGQQAQLFRARRPRGSAPVDDQHVGLADRVRLQQELVERVDIVLHRRALGAVRHAELVAHRAQQAFSSTVCLGLKMLEGDVAALGDLLEEAAALPWSCPRRSRQSAASKLAPPPRTPYSRCASASPVALPREEVKRIGRDREGSAASGRKATYVARRIPATDRRQFGGSSAGRGSRASVGASAAQPGVSVRQWCRHRGGVGVVRTGGRRRRSAGSANPARAGSAKNSPLCASRSRFSAPAHGVARQRVDHEAVLGHLELAILPFSAVISAAASSVAPGSAPPPPPPRPRRNRGAARRSPRSRPRRASR